MREKNTLLLFLSLVFINSIDAMAGRIDFSSDQIVFPDEFEKIKDHEENLIPDNIQATENVDENTDCDLGIEVNVEISPLPAIENRNIIGAPSRCPEGYRADRTGKCRKILN